MQVSPAAARATLVVVVAAMATGCGNESEGAAAQRPNVVMIVMDTTRGDRCGFGGYGRPTTPRIDALAQDGTTFRDCWSPSPWTGPAHASLFTGRRPVNHGFMQDRMYLPEGETLLAEILQGAGYRTACFSANEYVSPAFLLTQGFERFEPVFERAQRPNPASILTHRLTADWALDVHRRGEPFFLFVNDVEPHAPYAPPPRFAYAFAEGREAAALNDAANSRPPRTLGFTVGALDVSASVLAVVSDLYDAEIAALDEQIGLLLDELRAAGALDDTIVIITSDHGENLGDHGLAEHVFSVHRSLLHVPLVIWYPPAVERGRVVTDAVRLEDVLPTVLELCGVPLPANLDGASLLGDVGGRVARAAYARPTVSVTRAAETFPGADTGRFDVALRSAYDGRHHLIRASDGTEQLFDVSVDPLELSDISRTPGAPIERLRALLDD